MLWVESGSQMTFKDKVAFIAGGTGGLGRAVTQAFLAEGAKVIVTYRKKQEFDDLKQTAGGSNLSGSDLDVTDPAAVKNAFQLSPTKMAAWILWSTRSGLMRAG